MKRVSKYKTEQERIDARRLARQRWRAKSAHIEQAYRDRTKERRKSYLAKRYIEKKLERRADRPRQNELARIRRKANPEKYRAMDKVAYIRSKEAILERRKNTAKRIVCRTWVNNAVRDGRIERQACMVKNCNCIGEGHHSDYTKPTQVEWLCKLHHAAWHNVFEAEYGPQTSS